MPQAFYILSGAFLTIATCLALGRVLLRRLASPFRGAEEHGIAFVTGAALLSLAVFLLCAAGAARKGVFLAVGLAVILLAWREKAWRTLEIPAAPLPRRWRVLTKGVFAVFGVLYFFNAMAPEFSPDGSAYHLGVIGQYLRAHGFVRITTNMYANLSQGIELLYLFAYAIGRHSAASLVHLAFLVALASMMMEHARRIGETKAGAAAALLLFASPVTGIDATTAYIDLATAAIVFAVYVVLRVWDSDRRPALLWLAGLLAGFAYAAKYTAGIAAPFAVLYVAWRSYRGRDPWLRNAAIVSAAALLLIVPWMAKNWIILGNPVSPFLNAVFPNPYIHVGFEREYAEQMRHYDGLKSYLEIPFEVTVRGGVLCGLFGPVFLLIPIGLAAVRWREGRSLLLAGLVFGLPYAANVGTRFLIPAAPFLALALTMVLSRSPRMVPLVVLAHALLSWPSVVKLYAAPTAWRLEKIPLKQALRIESEESYVNFKMPGYGVARLVERLVPAGGLVFTFSQIPESYTTRRVIVGYQSAFNNEARDTLLTPMIPDWPPSWHMQFSFPPQLLTAVRVMQTANAAPDQWSVAEVRIFSGGQELPRAAGWKARAWPNPWGVQMAFDNSQVTRWRTWQAARPGDFIELAFGTPVMVHRVVAESSHDQYKVEVALEGQTPEGKWVRLGGKPQLFDRQTPVGLRRAATAELKRRGISHLLVFDFDYGAEDFRAKSLVWGLTQVGAHGQARLYRID